MKIDKFIGVLLVLFLLFVLSWFTQADFRAKNPALAELLGMTSSSIGETRSSDSSQNNQGSVPKKYAKPEIKIIGASVSFDGSYSQVVVYIGKNSPKVNLVNYILKTSNGSYSLPGLVASAGDYVLLTSNSSLDGTRVKKISPNHYEVYLSHKILSPGYETAELYSSAGALVSRYSYGLSALFQY